MPKEVKRWKCVGENCSFLRASKATVIQHEKRCWKNPENETCKTCCFKTEILHPDTQKAHFVMACTKDITIPYDNFSDKQGVVFNCPLWEAHFLIEAKQKREAK
jgi:hypothetical protein